jgi:phage gp45-like
VQRATPLDSSFRAYVAGGARGCTHEADDTKKMQEVKVNFLKNETRDKVEHPQNYGFTSYFRKAEKKNGEIEKCAEHFSQFMGGNRTFPVCEIVDDRRYRVFNTEEGEVTVYDDQQQSVKLKRKEIQARSQKRITVRLIKDEGQDKDDAERDQQKHKDKPLSSMMLDKDTIEIVRTKDDGQLAAKKDEQDKPGTMLSRVFLTKGDEQDKDKIIIETPEAHLTIDTAKKTIVNNTETLTTTIDEINKIIRQESETLSITIDEIHKTITLKSATLSVTIDEINKAIKLKTARTGVTLHENSGYVIVGDGVQGYQAAHLGSYTSKGDVIVAKVAKMVLVK